MITKHSSNPGHWSSPISKLEYTQIMRQTDHRILQRQCNLAPQFGWIKHESLLSSQRFGLKLGVCKCSCTWVHVCVRPDTIVHALDTVSKNNISQRLWILIWITWHTYLLTSCSRVLLEKLTGSAANQEIPCILWDPKVHYRTHKCPPRITWHNSLNW